ncbi:fibronectin type III domain-containing protein [uncultured Dokdonia sp.]|uniref:fibronectin type III domain-containing protein n=1 Tax=uncultured Dokdonia sp. TaxID=575653 RepID=UPI0026283657|nr:fibronectin type III domain-containing protein [uncultured Dokdonia sp.]
MKKILFTILVMVTSLITGYAQTPANDSCDNALLLECGVPLMATTINATNTDNDSSGNPEVFFSFTSGAAAEEVTFSLCNTVDIAFNPLMRIYNTADCTVINAQNPFAMIDSFCADTPQLTIVTTPNTDYIVSIETVNVGGGGDFLIETTCQDLTPPPAGECEYTLSLNTSSPNGWSGVLIDVFRNGLLALNNATLEDGAFSGSIPFSVLPDDEITVFVQDFGEREFSETYQFFDAVGEVASVPVLIGSADVFTPFTTSCPDCLRPNNIMTPLIGDTSIQIDWDDQNVDPMSSSFEIEWGTQGFELGTGTVIPNLTETTFLLENLERITTYDIYLRSNCSDGMTSTSALVQQLTEGEGDCMYTINMFDSFGDGWNGDFLSIFRNGSFLLNVQLEDGEFGSATFPVLDGDDITTQLSDVGFFPGEISYDIVDPNGVTVGSGTGQEGGDIMPGTITTNCSGCLIPTMLNAEDITETTASISWTDVNDPAAMSYTIEWGISGFTPGTGTVIENSTETSLLLENLDPLTTYDFYVIAVCGADNMSSLSEAFSFTTIGGDCEYSLELLDDFNGDWEGATISIFRNGILLLSDITLENEGNPIVPLPILNGDDITTMLTNDGDFPEEISYNILDINGEIVGSGDANNNIVTGTVTANCATCNEPNNLSVNNITQTSANVLWEDTNPNVPATSYTVEWGLEGFTLGEGTMITGITETTTLIDGLESGTSYEFYVLGTCDSEMSTAAGPFNFVTAFPEGDCIFTLQMLDSFGDGWNGAQIDVLRNGGPILNNVTLGDDPNNNGQMGVLTFEVAEGDEITTVFVNPGDIPADITYNILDINNEIILSGDPDNDITMSAPVENCTVLSVEDNVIEGFSYYPNPAKDILNLTAQTTLQKVIIYNILGQEMISQEINDISTSINVSQLAQGAYILRVSTDNQSSNFTFIVD